jgi:tryptophan-rich sensory protein
VAVVVCEGAGIIGTVFTINSVATWYTTLNKSFFNPPSWVFGPVWTILYFLMGVSLFLAWEKKANLKWFYIQLVLNALWSPIFFGLQNPALALVDIIFMWVAILMTIKVFWKKNRLSAYLLIPYFIWVSFATILNLSIVLLNR